MTYSLTSTAFSGEVLFTYDENNLLIKFEIKADLESAHHIYILKMMPGHVDTLMDWDARKDTITVTEVPDTVTFAMFWERYDDKIRSSKKKSEQRWIKHSKADQVRAYNFIPTYNRNRGTAEKKYAETYLNAELWNN